MASKFQAELHKREEITYLKLSGVIDEDNDLGPLADRVTAGTAVIDVSEIERINSCGVRDWVNWLGKLEKQSVRPVLVECSPSIVAQVNLVNNFTGSGVVKSFYAPYFCPSCDREKVLLIQTRDTVGISPYKAPSCRCDECDGPMDFDDMEDSYFAFLSNAAKIATDSRVDDVVTEFTPSDGAPKLRTRTGLSNPGTATPTPLQQHTAVPLSSLPSVPSLPSLKRLASENFSAVTTGRHVLSPVLPSGQTGRHVKSPSASQTHVLEAPAVFTAKAVSGIGTAYPSQLAPAAAQGPSAAASRAWLIVMAVLVAAALGLVGYLFFGSAPTSSAAVTTTGAAP